MNTRTTLRVSAIALAAAVLIHIQPAAASINDEGVDCRTEISKSFAKLMKSANKIIAGCHKSKDKGDTALSNVDCNSISTSSDPKLKYSKAVGKAVAKMNGACPSTLNSTFTALNSGGVTGESELYVSCPVTCGGVANPIITMTDAVTCLGCQAAAVAGAAGDATLGDPTQGTVTGDAAKCHGAIAKGYSKYMATALKAETACQKSSDEAGNNQIAACSTSDPKGKVAKALTKAGDGLDKACAGVTLTALDGCATDTLANLKTCTASEWTDATGDAYTSIYKLPGTLCPTTIRSTILAGCSTDSSGSTSNCDERGAFHETTLSVGWKGLGHGFDLVDSYTLAGNVTCGGTTAGSCGVCNIDSVSYDNPQYTSFTRCIDDPSIPCTTPFGIDFACGAYCLGDTNVDLGHPQCTTNAECLGLNTCQPGACAYFLGPPLPVSAGSTPTCTGNYLTANVTGTTNPDTGSSELNLFLRAKVHTGPSQAQPCPICVGDDTPKDGIKDGTCKDGAQDGLPCDVQGFDLSFAITQSNTDDRTVGLSLDCPPNPDANISGQGLVVDFTLTSGTASMTAEDACDGANSAFDCFCGVCSGDGTKTCHNDADCTGFGGSCVNGTGVQRQPNDCSGFFCAPVPGQTDRGICSGAGTCSGSQTRCRFGPDMSDSCVTNGDCSGYPCDTVVCTQDSNCFVCVNDSTVPCTGDPDCAGVGGSCDVAQTCDNLGSQVLTNYCDGLLFASGEPVISCTGDNDCDAYHDGGDNPADWVCPNDQCGTCSAQVLESCFLSPTFSLTGTPDPVTPVLVGTFCLPPSSSIAVNGATGSPGPGDVKTAAVVDLRYAP